MAQKWGASAHKFSKAPGNLHFPGTGALTDPLIDARTPGRGQHQWDILLKPALICPVNPRVGKPRHLEAPGSGKEWKIQSWGKPLASTLHSITHNSSLKQSNTEAEAAEGTLPPPYLREAGRRHRCPQDFLLGTPAWQHSHTNCCHHTGVGVSWRTKSCLCWQCWLRASRWMKNTILQIRICIK